MINSSAQTSQSPQQAIPKPPKLKKNNLVLIVLLIISIVVGAAFLFNNFKKTDKSGQEPKVEKNVVDPTIQADLDNNLIAMKIGEEYIYRTTFDEMLAKLPPPAMVSDNTPEKNKMRLSEKIIKNSITLQQAKKEGLIQLDGSFYNSKSIDYDKRVDSINTIIKDLNDSSYDIEGSLIAIWFANMKVGKLGLVEGKKLAYETIKPLYDSVKAGQMTMEEVAEAIKSNTELANIDPVYQGNAHHIFKQRKGEGISFSSDFDNEIRSLNAGEMTELNLIKDDVDDEGFIEAVYMFAKVDKKKDTKFIDYNNWFEQNKNNYEVIRH